MTDTIDVSRAMVRISNSRTAGTTALRGRRSGSTAQSSKRHDRYLAVLTSLNRLSSVLSVNSVANYKRPAIVTRLNAILIALLLCLTNAVGAEPKVLSQQLLDEGWISLFDGQTLIGWQ